MKVALKDVLPNPNRDLTFNPYNENKIAELVASIQETDFWDNVVIRKSPTLDGKYEMAYGHHRVEAARRSGITEADFIVKDLNDDKMLRMMDLENSKEYGYSILSLLEVVKAVVSALAEGRIPPFDLGAKVREDNIRYAPSFAPGGKASGTNLVPHPYTALDVATRLGAKYTRAQGERSDKKVLAALDTLWLLETKDLTISSVRDLNVDQLYKLTGDIKRRKAAAIVARTETSAVATKLHAEKAKVDAERHKAEERERKATIELQRRQAAAQKEQDEAAAERLSAEYKRRTEDAAKRALHFEAKRAILDAQIQENNQRSEAAREQDKDLPVRHAASACLTKLKTIASEKNALRQELKSLSLKNLSQAERENLRQALLAVATWFEDQSIAFRPAIQVDVLKEARQKEKK